jgi:uncharacterized membrane protein YfcA
MDGQVVLILITLFAAIVNGGLGYGFSSLTMPVALVFYTNRLLNPAMVLIEVCVNIYVLVMNRGSLGTVWPRVYPIVIGIPVGVAIGSFFLTTVSPGWIKLFTYSLLLPMILIQAAGIRYPIQNERKIGGPFGVGIGFLYAMTTISGPPLAVLFNNQGLVKKEFRAALGLIRTVEACVTATAYTWLGLYSAESFRLLVTILPSVIIGIPIGVFLIRNMNSETFRRICMTFDVWVVGFGLSRVFIELKLLPSPWAYGLMATALIIDAWLLYVYFSNPQPAKNRPAETAHPLGES